MTFTNLSKKRTILILAGLMVGVLMASLDSTIVTTAMPKIISSLKGFDYYTWPLIGFLLCMTVSMPLFGKLSDSFGFKPVYVFGIVVFLTGSALCGLSQNMIQLILFRGLQGIGAAILISNTLAIVGILFPPTERAKYIGIVSSVGALSSIIGPTLGGNITDYFSWRWIFYINVPIGIAALVITLFALPGSSGAQERKRIDYLGALVLVAALVPLLLAFTWGGKNYDWNSVQIIGMLVFSAIMLLVFGFIEHKASDPIIPLTLFKKSIFSFSAAEMFLINALTIGAAIFIPLFIQVVKGSTASKSGNILTPLMLSLIVGGVLGGIVVSKTRKYKLQAIIGLIVIILGAIMLTSMNMKTANSRVVLNMVVFGLGAGIILPIFNVTAQNAFPESQLGVVTSAIQFFKSIGQTIASSVLGTILTSSVGNGLHKQDISQFPTNMAGVLHDPNTFSSVDAINRIQSKLPPKLLPDFQHLLDQVKVLMSDAISHIFMISVTLAAAALVIAFFIKESSQNNE